MVEHAKILKNLKEGVKRDGNVVVPEEVREAYVAQLKQTAEQLGNDTRFEAQRCHNDIAYLLNLLHKGKVGEPLIFGGHNVSALDDYLMAIKAKLAVLNIQFDLGLEEEGGGEGAPDAFELENDPEYKIAVQGLQDERVIKILRLLIKLREYPRGTELETVPEALALRAIVEPIHFDESQMGFLGSEYGLNPVKSKGRGLLAMLIERGDTLGFLNNNPRSKGKNGNVYERLNSTLKAMESYLKSTDNNTQNAGQETPPQSAGSEAEGGEMSQVELDAQFEKEKSEMERKIIDAYEQARKSDENCEVVFTRIFGAENVKFMYGSYIAFRGPTQVDLAGSWKGEHPTCFVTPKPTNNVYVSAGSYFDSEGDSVKDGEKWKNIILQKPIFITMRSIEQMVGGESLNGASSLAKGIVRLSTPADNLPQPAGSQAEGGESREEKIKKENLRLGLPENYELPDFSRLNELAKEIYQLEEEVTPSGSTFDPDIFSEKNAPIKEKMLELRPFIVDIITCFEHSVYSAGIKKRFASDDVNELGSVIVAELFGNKEFKVSTIEGAANVGFLPTADELKGEDGMNMMKNVLENRQQVNPAVFDYLVLKGKEIGLVEESPEGEWTLVGEPESLDAKITPQAEVSPSATAEPYTFTVDESDTTGYFEEVPSADEELRITNEAVVAGGAEVLPQPIGEVREEGGDKILRNNEIHAKIIEILETIGNSKIVYEDEPITRMQCTGRSIDQKDLKDRLNKLDNLAKENGNKERILLVVGGYSGLGPAGDVLVINLLEDDLEGVFKKLSDHLSVKRNKGIQSRQVSGMEEVPLAGEEPATIVETVASGLGDERNTLDLSGEELSALRAESERLGVEMKEVFVGLAKEIYENGSFYFWGPLEKTGYKKLRGTEDGYQGVNSDESIVAVPQNMPSDIRYGALHLVAASHYSSVQGANENRNTQIFLSPVNAVLDNLAQNNYAMPRGIKREDIGSGEKVLADYADLLFIQPAQSRDGRRDNFILNFVFPKPIAEKISALMQAGNSHEVIFNLVSELLENKGITAEDTPRGQLVPYQALNMEMPVNEVPVSARVESENRELIVKWKRLSEISGELEKLSADKEPSVSDASVVSGAVETSPQSAGDGTVERQEVSRKFGEGEYEGTVDSEGLPDGKGIYTVDGQVRYEGSFKAGQYDGQGKLFGSDGQYFEGEFKDGEFQRGKMIKNQLDGSVFEGKMVGYKREGNGRVSWPNGFYEEGTYKDDKFISGRSRYATGEGDKNVYEGEVEGVDNGGVWNMRPHGVGILYEQDGTTIISEYHFNHGVILDLSNQRPKPRKRPARNMDRDVLVDDEQVPETPPQPAGAEPAPAVDILKSFDEADLSDMVPGAGVVDDEVLPAHPVDQLPVGGFDDSGLLGQVDANAGTKVEVPVAEEPTQVMSLGEPLPERGVLDFDDEHLASLPVKSFMGRVVDARDARYIAEEGQKIIQKDGVGHYKGEVTVVAGREVENGNGILYDKDGNKKYEGQFVNGKFEGHGKSYDGTFLQYEGEFINGQAQGQGRRNFNNGDYREGFFERGRFIKGRTRHTENGLVYLGECYLDDRNNVIFDGSGKIADDNGEYIKVGQWKQGELYNGDARFQIHADERFEGKIINGEMEGTLKDSAGNVIYQGKFVGMEPANKIAYRFGKAKNWSLKKIGYRKNIAEVPTKSVETQVQASTMDSHASNDLDEFVDELNKSRGQQGPVKPVEVILPPMAPTVAGEQTATRTESRGQTDQILPRVENQNATIDGVVPTVDGEYVGQLNAEYQPDGYGTETVTKVLKVSGKDVPEKKPKYIGNFKEGKYNGQGKRFYEDGLYDDGLWKDGIFVRGKSRFVLPNGKEIYEGEAEMVDSDRNRRGPHGKGILYSKKAHDKGIKEVWYDGYFFHGEMVGSLKYKSRTRKDQKRLLKRVKGGEELSDLDLAEVQEKSRERYEKIQAKKMVKTGTGIQPQADTMDVQMNMPPEIIDANSAKGYLLDEGRNLDDANDEQSKRVERPEEKLERVAARIKKEYEEFDGLKEKHFLAVKMGMPAGEIDESYKAYQEKKRGLILLLTQEKRMLLDRDLSATEADPHNAEKRKRVWQKFIYEQIFRKLIIEENEGLIRQDVDVKKAQDKKIGIHTEGRFERVVDWVYGIDKKFNEGIHRMKNRKKGEERSLRNIGYHWPVKFLYWLGKSSLLSTANTLIKDSDFNFVGIYERNAKRKNAVEISMETSGKLEGVFKGKFGPQQIEKRNGHYNDFELLRDTESARRLLTELSKIERQVEEVLFEKMIKTDGLERALKIKVAIFEMAMASAGTGLTAGALWLAKTLFFQ